MLVFSAISATLVILAELCPCSVAQRPPFATITPSLPEIQAAAATNLPLSPVSQVRGRVFDRILQIWLENENYEGASGDQDMQWLANQGILLTNYWAVTHPSQPNYVAAAAGEHFGIDSGDFIRIPGNVSTVVDLLDTRGISWGCYQENLPYPGFEGFNFSDQRTFQNNYVRKHNPLIHFDSVVGNSTRLRLIKDEKSFQEDLQNERLPQWSFFTPNMLNDGHDTNVAYASRWTRTFIEPLLNNTYFMNRTLVIINFDESEVYGVPNKVFTVLLGGAIPPSLRGTQDDTFYTHYSTISTVSVNWDLPSLGRWDCGANLLALVADAVDYSNAVVCTRKLRLNKSYPGPLSNGAFSPGAWPVPNTAARCASGNGVLPEVVDTWGARREGSYNYTNLFPYDLQAGVEVEAPRIAGVRDRPFAGGAALPLECGVAKAGGTPWLHLVAISTATVALSLALV